MRSEPVDEWRDCDGKSICIDRKDPETLGISSRAISDFIDAVHESKLELHSFMLLRHCAVAAEGWWAPYAPEFRHALYSLTKSFTSTGIGLAVQEGRLSLDDQVISFFPDDQPSDVSENLAAMRIRHLLTMSTGHSSDVVDGFRLGESGLVRAFLELPVEHVPGTHFVYNTPASCMLSAIVTKVTGQTLADYLKPRLLDPLGIDADWELTAEGISNGGYGLSIRTEDIAKFGQLYLNKGVWQGRRLLPEEWVSQATSKQVSNGNSDTSDWMQGIRLPVLDVQVRSISRRRDVRTVLRSDALTGCGGRDYRQCHGHAGCVEPRMEALVASYG